MPDVLLRITAIGSVVIDVGTNAQTRSIVYGVRISVSVPHGEPVRETFGNFGLQAVVNRIGIAQLVRNTTKHSAAKRRVLGIPLIKDAPLVGFARGFAGPGNRSVDVPAVQQLDAAVSDITDFHQPISGYLRLHLKVPVVRIRSP